MTATTKVPATILVSITQAEKVCRRYAGKTMTHQFLVDGDITAEKVEAIRVDPKGTGELYTEEMI